MEKLREDSRRDQPSSLDGSPRFVGVFFVEAFASWNGPLRGTAPALAMAPKAQSEPPARSKVPKGQYAVQARDARARALDRATERARRRKCEMRLRTATSATSAPEPPLPQGCFHKQRGTR